MAWTVDGLAFNTRKALTIDSTLIDEDLTNFVIEAMRTDDGDIGADLAANGGDIRFTLVNGTVLTYERELWSLAGGLATFVHHVEVPSVPSAANTVLYCYYNTSTGSPPDGDDGGAGNSWDANFKGVYHLNQDPSGGAPQILDSTANNKDGTSAGSMTSGDLVDAQVGKGLDFDGSDDYIDVGDVAIDLVAAVTIEAWVKRAADGSKVIVAKGTNEINTALVAVYPWSDGNIYFDLRNGSSSYGYCTLAGTAWHHVAMVFDGAQADNATRLKGYIDSAAQTLSFGGTIPTTTADPVDNQYIGRIVLLNSASYTTGQIDEVRISNIARSAAWIKASYNSQNGSLITWGAEETAGVTHEGTATFTGAGALTSQASLTAQAAASLSGIGILTSSAQLTARTTASFAGVGTFTTQPSTTLRATASMSGSGILTAQPRMILRANTSMSGSGTLTTQARLALRATASFAGVSTLSALAHLTAIGRAAFTAIGTFISAANVFPLSQPPAVLACTTSAITTITPTTAAITSITPTTAAVTTVTPAVTPTP